RSFAASTSLDPAFVSEIKAVLAARDAAEARLRDLKNAPVKEDAPRAPLPITPLLAQMKAITEAHGSRLVVLTVPLAAQTSAEAQAQSGMSAKEVATLGGVVAEVTAEALASGAEGVDPTGDLSRAGGGVYLPGGHLSAKGHDIVAKAV